MATQEVDLALPPIEVVERLRNKPYLFALDGGGTSSWGWGRALIGCRPTATLHVAASGNGVVRAGSTQYHWQGDPLEMLEHFRGETRPAGASEPFSGGVVVALSYDLCRWIEPRHAWREPPGDSLVLYAAAYDNLLSYDYSTGRYHWGAALPASPRAWPADDESPPFNPQTFFGRQPQTAAGLAPLAVRPEVSRKEHIRAIRAALAYIAAGDIYQVNLAQRFVADGTLSASALYAAMQRQHPMPFSAYVDCGDVVLASNSPECLLLRDRGTLSTFPIKGTRPRSVDAATDRKLAAELLANAKEMAEHVMIVDLERNDLGRVCTTGSVRVDELARVHSFPSLHHLVSKVTGALDDDVSLADILRATFPGGSITGAPKIRAMEIIAELEPFGRGFYTGSIGFLDDCGRASFSIVIRTAVVTANRVTYHAGGGIVADSNAAREYDEILLKAHPFFTALRARAA